jgi:hypothetical protein
MPAHPGLRASCACGAVTLEAKGAPMMTAVCYCDDCQKAGGQIQAMAGAQPVLDGDGGTAMVMFRKDRLRCVEGAERLTATKLNPKSPTTRYVARCCNSAMYLGFDDAKHWVDVFRNRVTGEPPPVQARVCTRFRQSGEALPADAPAHPGYPPSMIPKLLGSRIAMLFGP